MEINKKTLKTIFFGAAGCILLYWLLHETQRITNLFKLGIDVLSPFIVGAAMAFVLNVPMRPIEKWLSKIRKPGPRRALAIVLTLLAVFAVLFLVATLLAPQIQSTVESLIAELPGFVNRLKNDLFAYLEKHPEILEWLQENTDFESLDWNSLVQKAVSLLGNGASTIMNSVISAVGSVSSALFDAVLSFVFSMYCLAQKEILARQARRILYSFLPEKACDETIRILRLTNATFSHFISGQCLEAVILGAMFAVSMTIFGFPYIPLVSVIITITALVPIVGAFAGCALGALFILVDNPAQAFWFIGMFLLLQQIEGNLIYPKVVGTSIGLPGMWVLLAVAVGGDLMGIGGMLVMIPIASVCYSLLREFTNKRLAAKNIDPDKLLDHPLEITSKFKERRLHRREKRKQKIQDKASKKQD